MLPKCLELYSGRQGSLETFSEASYYGFADKCFPLNNTTEVVERRYIAKVNFLVIKLGTHPVSLSMKIYLSV